MSLGHTDSLLLSTRLSISGINVTSTIEAFKQEFEDAYVEFVRFIRQVAYPVYFNLPSGLESDVDLSHQGIKRVIPIYLLYPFNNRDLNQCIRRAAVRLTRGEEEGYSGAAESKIYEVDTSSWMSNKLNDIELRPKQYVLGGNQSHLVDVLSLTPVGHEKATAYLKPRVCRYLARNPRQECPDYGELEVGGLRWVTNGDLRTKGPSPERQWRQMEQQKARESKLRGSFIW